MAHSTQCFLPKFGSLSEGPKQPMSMRTRTSSSETTQLISAWQEGQLDALLQTTWALVLYRYTGSADICFGCQHLTAHDYATHSSDSATIRTCRLSVSEDDSIRGLLEKAKGQIDLADSAEKCGTLSGVTRNFRLYNTMMMIQNCRETTTTSTDTPVAVIALPNECHLRLHVKVLYEDIGIFMEWWNNDISTEQIRSMSSYLQQMLTRVLMADDTVVSKLSGISESDWARICKFNAETLEAHDRCIHETIHEQTVLQPESEAVCAWDGSLTYSKLDLLASQLAYHLQAQGVGPEVRVALCFDKSKWNIVALLAVLKAGGAFVPLDPTHPAPRLQSLVRSVQARIMLCSRNHAQNLRAVVEHLIPLDSDTWEELSIPCGDVSLSTEVKGSNAAYVIFTSGSTGEPKGTLMEHKAYVSSAMAHAPRLRVFAYSRLLQFAAHTFDASLVEILTSLLVGACICVPSEEARLNNITKVINDMRVNHATLTPSFIDFVNISDVPNLETLVLAGEAMSQSHLEIWSKINLVNGFGPTETAVTAAVNSKVTRSSDSRDIGLPTGVHCWIVDSDDHNQLVPVGCVGEMLAEGPSLARGYVNNQQKTDEVFIYDPSWAKRQGGGSGRRFYKTGDLVRYNSEAGSLTYIGRKDTQVKFHGQRIELGEIEDNLNTDSNIRHCLVFLPKSGFSEGRIVAVLSLPIFDGISDSDPVPLRLLEDSKKNSTISQIRDRLSARLPAYMIPTVWLCVETLPMLVSGKLDRKATANWVGNLENDPNIQLTKLDPILSESSTQSENATEERLASIWSRVLNIPRTHISLDESFLGQGGDSIAGLTCVGFCTKQGIGITVQDILRSKSIRDLATRAKEIQQPASYEETIEKPFGLSPIQKLHFMVRQEGQGHFNQSVLTRLNQQVDEYDLRRSIETLISRHSMLRSRLADLGTDGLQQRITEDVAGSYRWRMHDVNRQDQIEHAIADSQASINVFTGPVLAVDMFNGNGKDYVLSLVAHHLVVDIVSWRIILEDLEDLLLNPDEAKSQTGSLPFQTWCQMQADKCQELNTTLDDLPPPDFAYWGMEKCPITYGDVDCETFEVDAESTRTLLMDCHQSLQTEPIDVFLASLLHSFLQTFSDRSLPVIYNEGHGREVWDSGIDISRTVGWFTILHPITLHQIAEDDPVKTLIRVKDLRRRVMDNGRQDFARRLVGDAKDRGHPSPMEISFNYVGQHRDLQRQDGLFQLMNQMAGEAGRGGGAADFGEKTPRFALFEISAMGVQGRLRFTFSFNRYMKHQQSIRHWISNCHDLLKHLGSKLQSLAPKPTLSSFPMLSLTYEELETIFSDRLPNVGIKSFEQVEDIYPCSRMQQGILLSRSRDEGFYSVHDTFEVKSSEIEPDVNQLVLAWQQVVMHHPMLRTIFVDKLTSRELFCQVVLKTIDSQPSIIRCVDESEVLAAFDEQDPMTYVGYQPPHRFTICQTASGKLFCRLEINHVSMDGSSISIIARDLQLAYAGKLETHRRPMFKNFLHYLREQDDSTGYWCSYLSDCRPCHFPVLNDGIISEKKLRSVRLNVNFYSELLEACEKSGVTLSAAISTAWGLTLGQFCGSSDVCFSYLASLRDMPVEDIESVVGPVITLLACRMKIPGNGLLEDILHRVQNDYMEQLSHRNTSLIDIQHALKLSDTTLFNTGVSYRKLPPNKATAEEVQLVEVGSIYDPAEFPVYVNVEVAEDDARIDLNYWTTALSVGQAENVASVFLKALENIAQYQDTKASTISDIDFLSEQACTQLCEWNAKLPDRPEKCAHEVIQQQALYLPLSTPAICSWDANLTYSDVEHLSTRLAQYLIGLGVGSETFVTLFFEKSAWYVIAQVAVLKAGGAFVALDPSHPEARLRGLVEDVGAYVMLCSVKHTEKASRLCDIVFGVCEATIDGLVIPATVMPAATPSIHTAAYAIFTSGTTGKPKVSVIEHISLGIAASTFPEIFRVGPGARVLQFSNYIFDVHVLETVITLMAGGCICIPSEEERLNDLSGAINRMGATMCTMTPSTTNTLNPESVPTLGTVVTGGEIMTKSHVDRWADRRVINAYGPSEATVASTASVKADGGRRLTEDYNSIGTAFAGRSWIVDPDNYHRLLPIGAIGELVLEGCNVGRGYLNNVEKTREVFITDARWTEHSGLKKIFKNKERMYRTGDLVRYNADGSLCFISRKDTQIKLNGQRIELGEVEQQCVGYLPANTQVAVEVITPEAKTVAKCLAVFFATGDHEEDESGLLLSTSETTVDIVKKLHSSLKESLPVVMIPKLFFPVRCLPIAATGKLDRKGLRAMVEPLPKEKLMQYTTFNDGSRQIAEGGAEGKLRALWEEALGLAPGSVGTDDSFFGIGGDSLSAMKLVSAADFQGVALTVADIYANPILADMAKICEHSEASADTVTVEPFSLLPSSVCKEAIQEVTDQCHIPEGSITDMYPCSPVQEGLITLSTKQQGAYIARPIFKLTDEVNLEQFRAAWQQTVDELDILRTRIVHTDSTGFLQVVLDKETISWTAATTIDEIMDETPELPNQSGGSLTAYAIVQPRDSSSRYFVWTIHHALYDGWSVSLILKRVEELYKSPSTTGSTLPYKLFISHLQDKDMSESDNFWRLQLADISCSPFPQSKASMSDAVRVGNRYHSSVEIGRTPEIKDLTLPELIRAAWAIVISAHTSSSDVCFGETLMGRNISLRGITEVAGPVLTTVPTRVQVDSELLVTQFLQNIRKLTTAMIPHQHSGLQRIRKLNDNTYLACDFQNLLVIQTEEGTMNGDLWVPENNQTGSDFFTHPLTVECKISGSKLVLTVHHDEIILDSWQTERLTNQFTHVIQQLLTFSEEDIRKVGDLVVASPQDKQEIISWNQRHPTRVDRCVHDIIREKGAAQPEAPAVCAWDGQLSYREMYGYASSFAAYLNSRGVGPETLVPICLDKSVWAIVTILGILIAGGAFVPLDPAHPTSRHKEILEDIEARVILCSPQYRNRYAGSVKTIVPVSQETIRAYSALTRKTPSPNCATPSNMAYAIFTSGSTGRPKGIIIDHRALASSATAFSPIVHLNENSRAFQFASLTFDAAVMEVLATLMHGGCICIPSEDERLNDVAGAIRRMDVSWAFLTPSIASIIEPSTVPSLKVLACGGEKLSREVVLKWAHRVKLINGYGPTETTIFAVLNDVTPGTEPACIGYGIPSTLTWVVDPENHNRLSPLGAIGELALEGAALAREYLKSPEKTADAFVTEPTWIKDFPSSLPSPRRIYKTGDLVRYNPDGSIEYISRKDHQVKIHGLRMELGEIEHRLCEDRRVRHAVVILPKSGLIQKRLVAILSLESLNSGSGLNSDAACELISQDQMDVVYSELEEIQKGLESQLPIYMVPQTWAVIKKLPMLVSGKLDRKRITAWIEKIDESIYDRIMQDYDNIKRGNGNTEYKNEEDHDSSINVLRDIFTQVLNIPSSKIDSTRSFVSLGGDSITGMAVISRARKHGLNLTLHNILQSKSITELALTSTVIVQTIKHEEKSGELFDLSPIQGLFMQMTGKFQGRARFNQSMTVRLTKRTRPDIVKNTIKAVVDRHSMFRARFSKSSDGNWQQTITKDIDSSYRFRTHSINSPSDMLPEIAESQQCLDIQNGPIFAADLFEVRGHEQVLFVVANHLCVDMVSWRIVLQDMQEFIETGTLSSDKPLSFQGWCDLQVENSKRENGVIQLPFSIEPPNLAYWGMANSQNLYGHVKMESFTLNEEATAFILGRCHEALRTETVEILLSSVIHSFRRVFADRNVPTIYNEGHGREAWDASIDLSRTVGWFTTMCPLHVDGASDIINTLKRVKDTRRKIANDSRSYFAQSLLHPPADGSTSFPVPLEVVFNYLGQLQQLERKDSLFQHYGGAFDAETFELSGDMGPQTSRFALFEISAIIIKDKLHVSFTYNLNMQHRSRIQNWVSECRRTLEEEILSLKDYSPAPTLSDYPLLPTTYGGLDDLVKKTLPKAGVESWDRVEDIYPCSPVQEGILLSQLRDPHGYMFHGIFEVRSLQGKHIDSALLRKAWAMVVSRHPALRTLFIDSNYKGGTFDQLVIKAPGDDILEFECDESLAFAKLDQVRLHDINANRRIKLPQHLTICTTDSGRVLMKLEMNHAVVDGGSIDVLFRDLALAYNNQLPAGSGPRYSDYIKYTRSQVHDKALQHWKQYLAGVHPCHLSFSAKPRGYLCEHNSVTLANLTLSAWAVVLRSFTGSDDICFGYPSAGRDSPVPGIHDAVGIFINMLCCRVKFTSGQTLEDVSKLVQSDYIGNLPHQNCSLAQIQHELGQQGQSLFNTTLSIQNRSAPQGPGDNIISFEMQRAHDPTEYPVTVNVETTKGREGIMLRYWKDTVSDSQAKDLANAIAKVFTCFIERPSRLVSELKLTPSHDSSAMDNSALMDSDVLNSDALKKLIDIRVNEIITRMLKEGTLAIPTVHELHIKASEGSFRTKRMPRGGDLSDSTLTLTNYSRASTDTRESTDLEKRLWSLWSSALGLSPNIVNRKGSFFKLGGDSITAMKMVGAAREEGLSLSVADVFGNPVFEDMLAIVVAKDTPAVFETHTQAIQLSEKVPESPVVITRAVSPDEISVLRPIPIDDSSLQSSICSKIGVFRGGIADVLPVTDFQAMSITASLFKSRWMLNYFFLDGKGPLDIRRLRESFLQVVDAFDILRTVFVCFHGQFFQVVLRKMRPIIVIHETEQSLDEYTESLQQRDREQDPRQGEQYVQFYVVKKKNTDHHRILIRMSHTQFDGVCLPRIMSAIKLGYEGSPIPRTSSFSNYMRMLPGNITPEHYQHWSTLLQGSKMTDIIRRQTPNNFQHIGSFTAQKKAIEISATVIGDVTLATVMQSAWAMTLAKLSAQSDVVFGLTISGRNTTIPGIESTVGPCLNMIPVRVNFGDRWTGLDIFRYLQDQQVANMPYESLGFREIIRNCTDWPDSTFFTTSVFHQNVEYEGHMQLDDNMYRMGGVGVVDNFTDITVVSKPTGDGKLDITLAYSERSAITTPFAAKILDMLCETAHSLITNPQITLPSPSTLRSLPCQVIDDLPRPTEEHFLTSNLNSRSISELLVHSDILNKTWQHVLPNRHPETPRPPFQLNSSFFGLGGDIFSMGQLAWGLEQEGLQVRLEELLEHPTFLGHLAVLALHNAKQENLVERTRTVESRAPAPSVSVKGRTKSANWNPLGKALTLARRFTKKRSSKS
ncbi:nonribosomal peptide synthase Pes1 [Aspergillus bombycis]|uniref:Nonribosomal peptide synthase Pes1 n=1 Tax=Aspergillus bombycis TaxID=109264 RepID=A0A1F8A752_9EURO|nr:nonribosomal peptide synthase Pes1 [Aspergillus bombycis]OGM47600.1 nonribosomal peptide synthase Pes1 [Aspergillus bombycis]